MVIQVSVPESAQVGDHVEYKIEVAINGLPCSHSWRRFRNLYEVFRRLKRRHPDLPEAPKKRWPMMGMRSCDIEDRRLSIQEHLRSLFAHRCCASDDLRQLVGYHRAVQRRQHCVAAEVQAGLCARTLLARYWRALDGFRSGVSLQETLAKQPRRVRAATAQTDAGAGVLLLSESAVVDAGVDASASVEERLGVLVHKYQQECGEATKRAVSAELLATTLRHNRESMDCITKTCVFMPAAEGEGEPGNRGSASEGLLRRGGSSVLQHRSSSPHDRSAARLRRQPESPRGGGSNQNNSNSSSSHNNNNNNTTNNNNNLVSSGSGDRDATTPLNRSFSRSFAGRSLGGGGLSLTAASLAGGGVVGGGVGSKHSPASAVSAANSFAAANASDGTLPPYAPYGMAHSARVRIRSASVARYEQKNEVTLYTIVVQHEGRQNVTTILRRYTAFCELRDQLSEQGITVPHAFPGKFIGMGGLETRRSHLDAWVASVLSVSSGDETCAALLEAFLPEGVLVEPHLFFEDMHDAFSPFAVHSSSGGAADATDRSADAGESLAP